MKTIRFEREEAAGHIVLANPPTNYLDRRYCECLARAVHEAESDVRVVLVRAGAHPGHRGGSTLSRQSRRPPIQHGRLHTGFPEHGQGVRSRYRAAGGDFLQSLKKGFP